MKSQNLQDNLANIAADVAQLESEMEAIKQALDDSGVPTTVHAPNGQGRELTLVERVYLALTRLAPFEGPAYNDLCRDSNDLQRLLNALRCLTWPASDVEGVLNHINALASSPPEPADLRGKIAQALNCHSAENASSTPDYVLADFLLGCLAAWDVGVNAREAWHGRPAPECAGPEVVEPEPAPGGHVCPGCGAAEVEALDTSRTVYACGSSDYDQRPNTHLWSTQCLRDAYAAARKNAEPKPELPTVGTYQVSGIPGVAEIKVCENGSLRIKWNGSPAFYFSVDTFADVTARHPNAVWTKVSNE